MKTNFSIRTSIVAALVLITCSSSIVSAQALRLESNWLQAWTNFAGTQYSASWLNEEIANGSHLYTEQITGTLVLTTRTDWATMDEMLEGLEEGIVAGNGNQMLANGASETIGYTAAQNAWKGQLGGRDVFATVAAQLDIYGGSQMVLCISLSSLYGTIDGGANQAVALLDQFGGDSQVSSLVCETK